MVIKLGGRRNPQTCQDPHHQDEQHDPYNHPTKLAHYLSPRPFPPHHVRPIQTPPTCRGALAPPRKSVREPQSPARSGSRAPIYDEPVEPLEAAVVWDADKLSKLGATAVLHFLGYKLMVGEGTTVQWLEELPDVSWMERTAHSFHTAPARAAGRKRLETYRALWRQALREFDGDDLLDSPEGVEQPSCPDYSQPDARNAL